MPLVTPLKARLELDTSNYTQGIAKASEGARSLGAVSDSVAKRSSSSVSSMTGGIVAALKIAGTIGALTIAAIAVGLISLITTLATLGVAIVRWGMQMWDTLAANTRPFSAFHDKMLELQTAINGLRGAWYALFVNLLAAALPVIIPIIQWLTKMLNLLSMVVAALTGQKTVYQAITVAATQAGNAAKGALAGFDQLDVLANNNNLLQFQQVPIDQGVLDKVNEMKKWFNDLWAGVVAIATWAWNEVKLLWTNPRQFFSDLWNFVVTTALGAWTLIQRGWAIAAPWLASVFISPVLEYFQNLWLQVQLWSTMAWVGLLVVWTNVTTWFKLHVTDPVSALFKSMANNIIGFLNGMLMAIAAGINAIAAGINAMQVHIPSWIPVIGGMSFVPNVQYMIAPKIPQLAEGAVIPANKPFMALMGDQKNGDNIETPSNLLRQIIQEELSNMKIDMTMNFEGSMAALAREMNPHLNKEVIRVGPSLVKNVQVQIS